MLLEEADIEFQDLPAEWLKAFEEGDELKIPPRLPGLLAREQVARASSWARRCAARSAKQDFVAEWGEPWRRVK